MSAESGMTTSQPNNQQNDECASDAADDEDITPTGSTFSLASSSSTSSFKSIQSQQENGHLNGSLKSTNGNSFASLSSANASFKSARSVVDNESLRSGSLRSLGVESFTSCSTYASFKSAKSHTTAENDSSSSCYMTPTVSRRSFVDGGGSIGSFHSCGGGSIGSFQSFRSAFSPTDSEYDEQTLRGSMQSLGAESFASLSTFASFKHARSDLSLSETLTGDNDFASLHRFCMNPTLGRGNISGTDTHTNGKLEEKEEGEETLLNIFCDMHQLEGRAPIVESENVAAFLPDCQEDKTLEIKATVKEPEDDSQLQNEVKVNSPNNIKMGLYRWKNMKNVEIQKNIASSSKSQTCEIT